MSLFCFANLLTRFKFLFWTSPYRKKSYTGYTTSFPGCLLSVFRLSLLLVGRRVKWVYFRGPEVLVRTFSLLVRDLHVLLEILFLVSKIFCFRLDHRSGHTINERGDTGNLVNAKVTN